MNATSQHILYATEAQKIQPGLERGFQLGYRKSLDGLRGLSILAVMAFHAELPLSRGGYLGVDIFFVLSGFLITTLLLQEYGERKSISLKKFYIRRGLRLLPALYTLLIVWSTYLIFFAKERTTNDVRAITATFFYFSNWASAYHWVALNGLDHTWSLAIEEQFYLIWPILLIALIKFRMRARTVVLILCIAIVSSAMIRSLLWQDESSLRRVYCGLDTRADSLLIGCLVGWLACSNMLPTSQVSKSAVKALAMLAAAVIGYLMLRVPYNTGYLYYYGGFTVVAASVGIILVELLGSPPKWVETILETRPLVWIGRLSYGLYLWHWPICWLIPQQYVHWKNIDPHWIVIQICRFGLTFLVSILSYYLIERRFLRIKKHFDATSRALVINEAIAG